MKRTRINPVNPKRRAARLAKCFGKQAELCRKLRCLVPGCSKRGEPHHDPTRGAGGVDEDTVPLCRHHHTERHTIGRVSFEAKHGLNLFASARMLREKVAKDL